MESGSGDQDEGSVEWPQCVTWEWGVNGLDGFAQKSQSWVPQSIEWEAQGLPSTGHHCRKPLSY